VDDKETGYWWLRTVATLHSVVGAILFVLAAVGVVAGVAAATRSDFNEAGRMRQDVGSKALSKIPPLTLGLRESRPHGQHGWSTDGRSGRPVAIAGAPSLLSGRAASVSTSRELRATSTRPSRSPVGSPGAGRGSARPAAPSPANAPAATRVPWSS
jgi:hypothetical protein